MLVDLRVFWSGTRSPYFSRSEQCRQRLERAEKLLANLGGEQDRWSIASDLLGVSYQNLTGDVVVRGSSARAGSC